MKRLGHDLQLATELGLSMGLMSAGWTLLGLWLGVRLDDRLGTQPIATLLLLLAGAAAGQLSMLRVVARARQRLGSDAKHVLSADDTLRLLRTALTLLVLLVAPVSLGLVLGVWLDARLGTRLVFTLLLAVGCLAAGLYGAVRVARAQATWGQVSKDQSGTDATAGDSC